MKIPFPEKSIRVVLVTFIALALSPEAVPGAEVIDDFNDGIFLNWDEPAANASALEQNGLLKLSGDFERTDCFNPVNTFAGWTYNNRTFTLRDGHTVQLHVDVIGANQSNISTDIMWGNPGAVYLLGISGDTIFLVKSRLAYLLAEPYEFTRSNLVLVLSLTRIGSDLHINCRVLDKANSRAVLFDRTVIDTPQVDPTLTSLPTSCITPLAEPGPPFLGSGSVALAIYQETDGNDPVAEALFDNVRAFEYDLPADPQMSIQKVADTGAFQLDWPETPEVSFALEQSDSLESLSWSLAPSGRTRPVTLMPSVMSRFFRLGQVIPLQITRQPEPLNLLLPGTNGTFEVQAVGIDPLQYQWRRNGTTIAEATNSNLSITNAQIVDEGNYSVVITDQAGSITSDSAALTFVVPPVIVEHPQGQTVMVGETVTFTVTVTNTATLPVWYRWRFGFENLTNQMLNQRTASYTINNVQTNQAGLYTVIVTNAAFFTPGFLSNPAELIVLE